jgi:hypothetical protein
LHASFLLFQNDFELSYDLDMFVVFAGFQERWQRIGAALAVQMVAPALARETKLSDFLAMGTLVSPRRQFVRGVPEAL